MKNRNGVFELAHVDEFVESMLTEESWCGQSLPRVQKRYKFAILFVGHSLGFAFNDLRARAKQVFVACF